MTFNFLQNIFLLNTSSSLEILFRHCAHAIKVIFCVRQVLVRSGTREVLFETVYVNVSRDLRQNESLCPIKPEMSFMAGMYSHAGNTR